MKEEKSAYPSLDFSQSERKEESRGEGRFSKTANLVFLQQTAFLRLLYYSLLLPCTRKYTASQFGNAFFVDAAISVVVEIVVFRTFSETVVAHLPKMRERERNCHALQTAQTRLSECSSTNIAAVINISKTRNITDTLAKLVATKLNC